jgi:hypothetical protein
LNAPPVVVVPHRTLRPAFTLASALRWLGHECVQRCSSSLDDLPATIWFPHPRNVGTTRGAIVLVDPTDRRASVARLPRLISDINFCTRTERIHVRGRRMADIGNAVRPVPRETAPLGRGHLHLVVQEPRIDDWANDGPDPVSGRKGVRLERGRVAPPPSTRPMALPERQSCAARPLELRQP